MSISLLSHDILLCLHLRMSLEFRATQALFLREKEWEFIDSRAWRLGRLGSVVIAGCRPACARIRQRITRSGLFTPAAAVSERVTMHSTRRRVVWPRRNDVGALLPIFSGNLSGRACLYGVTEINRHSHASLTKFRASMNLRTRIGFPSYYSFANRFS